MPVLKRLYPHAAYAPSAAIRKRLLTRISSTKCTCYNMPFTVFFGPAIRTLAFQHLRFPAPKCMSLHRTRLV
jgi:hypothetical protein